MKLKSSCISKETINKVKDTLRMEESRKNEITDKGLISKIYKQPYSLAPETQTTQSKSGQKMQTDIFPKKTYRWLINT